MLPITSVPCFCFYSHIYFSVFIIYLFCRFLTGNPCTDYEGYKEYVIATLPQLMVCVVWVNMAIVCHSVACVSHIILNLLVA